MFLQSTFLFVENAARWCDVNEEFKCNLLCYGGNIVFCIAFQLGEGLLNSDQVGRINTVLKRAKKYHLFFDLQGLLVQADCELFEKIQSEHHCLHHHLPLVRTGYQAFAFDVIICLTCLSLNCIPAVGSLFCLAV
jgi:hypothetical protein